MVESEQAGNKPLFRDLNANEEDPELTEIESLCMQCHNNGSTKLLLTKIPFFKEVIIMSFECPSCGLRNNEIQPGSMIQEKGVRCTFNVNGIEMLNRQIVRQASASYFIKEIDFEAPAFNSKGVLTTLEGLLVDAIDSLKEQQSVRKKMQPEFASKVDEIISSLEKYKSGTLPFTFQLEDVSGNSCIENSFAPENDPCLTVEWFERTKEQNEALGLSLPDDAQEQQDPVKDDVNEEVHQFGCNCPECGTPAVEKMKIVQIPFFKDVVIMCLVCDACGYKSNEVKAGGAIEDKGRKIVFKMTEVADLSRDVLVSHSCNIILPDVSVELGHASVGGTFTTLEGLLTTMKDQLGKINPFAFGDSASSASKLKEISDELDLAISGKNFLTVILDDPLGNSFLQNLYAPDPDPELQIFEYERTQEQNDEFGISDMQVANLT